LTPHPNHLYVPSPSRPTQRGVGHRHERGTGCGGRGSVGRVSWLQGGLSSVSERSAQTTGANIRMNPSAKPAAPGEALWAKPGKAAYGKTVWSRHPLLVSSRRRSVDPTGSEQSFNPPATEARRIRLRGELGISRQTIAQGMSDALRCPVCSCASHHSFCTRDRRCSAHPAFPAPSFFERCGNDCQKLRAPRVARSQSCIRVETTSLRAQRLVRRSSTSEGGSNPLSPSARKHGLLRCARNDERLIRNNSQHPHLRMSCDSGSLISAFVIGNALLNGRA